MAVAGDTVAIETPAYFGFLEMIESLNLRALEIVDGKTMIAILYAAGFRLGR